MGCGGSKDGGASSPTKTQTGARTGKVKPEQVVVQVNGHSSPNKNVGQSPTKGQGSVQPSPYGSPRKTTGSPQKFKSTATGVTVAQQPVVAGSGARAARGANQTNQTNQTYQSGGYGGSGDQTSRSRQGVSKSYEAQNDVVRSEPNDKGYKRRVRERLRQATEGKDMEELERAIAVFNKSNMEDCGDLTDALDRLRYLKLRRDLRDAIRRRHVGVLDKAIEEARNSHHAPRLQSQIEAAERMRSHLVELDRYKHDILQMEQTTISEIHSYQRPPACVHDVMAATYMLLGYHESRLTDWADIQGMLGRLGRDKLIKQVEEFDTATVEPQTATRVREILDYHKLEEVRDASNGAARFYVWCSSMVDKCERDSKDEEERRVQEEQKQQQGGRKKQG